MNLQTDLSGQISGKVPNQVGTPLSVLLQQNGNHVSAQNQTPTIMHGSASIMEPERRYMRQKIFEVLMQQHQQSPPNKISEILKCLEIGLFKNCRSKEEYLNLATLRSRLQVLIKRKPINSHNQRLQQVNSTPSLFTMIPTPGFQQPGNSNVTEGDMASEYQQSSLPVNVLGNNMVPSMGVQRQTTQMIPTPGFKYSSDINDNSNNQSRPNIRTAFPAVKSSSVSQNSHILHNLGGPVSGGVKSTLPHNSSGLPNGPLNVSLMNVPRTMEGYTTGTMLRNSPQPLNQQLEHQQPVMQGDGYGSVTADVSGPGNLHAHRISTGLMTNNQCLSAVSLQKIDSTMISNQSTDSTQVTIIKPQSIDRSNKMNSLSQCSVSENLLQLHQSRDKTLVQPKIENQVWLNDDNFNQSQPSPSIISEAKSRPGADLQQLDANPQNNFGTQSNSKSQNLSHVSRRQPIDQDVQDELHQRLNGQDVAQLNNISSEESLLCQSHASRLTEPLNMSESVHRSSNVNREQLIKKQQKWLLCIRHARRCPFGEGKCPEPNCSRIQKLFKHIACCQESQCSHPECRYIKTLISHYRSCHDANCPVCVPVKNKIQAQRLRALASSDIKSEFPDVVNGTCKSYDMSESAERLTPETSPVLTKTSEDLHPPIKRMKIEYVEGSGAQHVDNHLESYFPNNSEISKVKIEVSDSFGQSANVSEIKNVRKLEGDCVASQNPSGYAVQDVIKHEKEMEQVKSENVLASSETESASKSGKPKITGVSMTEFFTPEQVMQHIKGLRQWVGQSKAKAERNQAVEHSMSENSCQLCAVEKLTFEPPPLYCTPCGARIKRNAMYYTIGTFETRHYFCIPCYNGAQGGTMIVDGFSISKARMEKKWNDEETGEAWVQCDKCEAWQHQICALFNGKRNDCGQAEYVCPKCYIEEVERGERVPLPQSAVLGAKDLPRTILSDHLEQRLFAKLVQERQDRARIQGKQYDEVPGAESLVVRVVSSVEKKMEVKPQFLQIFKDENYPSEFPYKSKVVLLFQEIEGVDVCLFGMYLQEYGSECQHPNPRRVYLSYLDSVKYFRPEVKAVTGEALRTFVYHEILVAYLEYCKQRGFTSCYIWACPPLKGEDYILYCHPEIQKTPKSDKLREWYLSMLRKATNENIVVGVTNLYDHFFVSNGECKAKITASRMPYFDGDYWPGAAEDIISQLQQEEDGKLQYKKGAMTMKMTITKRALKASGQIDLSGKASKDLMLMHKLGEIISPMKGDFIMVHLRHACKHCCILMVSGKSWVCEECTNFRLCDKCYEDEQKREDRERHPVNKKDTHALYPVEINGVPADTKDKDELLESEFFDTRQAFLSLCQGNHYQYDTLRRAKHSSMIILYHLHNPSAPAFVATCNICHIDIEHGQGLRCSTCPDYDVCNSCYQKDGGMSHPHELTSYSANDCNAQNAEARALRLMQLKNMLELLAHASQCRLAQCQTQSCCKVKQLLRHGMVCKIRAIGGCDLCRKMWNLLRLHARSCKESECTVPRCRELKEHLKRVKYQSESRRRAAVNEMMRQRAA